MQILLIVVALAIIGYFIFSRQDKVGHAATGDRLARMQATPTYKDGAFENLEYTPSFAEDESFFSVFRKLLFGKSENTVPTSAIPHVKTDLNILPIDSNLIVWFGHSSYYLQLDGKRILVDPVFSGNVSPAAPFSTIKAFEGADTYQVSDMPSIDLLVITHDHWDHLDYETVKELQPNVKEVITGLGVGAHLKGWGYPEHKIHELYWGEQATIAGLEITSCTARHFSGRLFKRNLTLWSSFILKTNDLNIYVGGDSGYGKHFKEIGEQYGPFDLAILENGQYNESWKYIHLLPEELVTAAKELRAKRTFPVHNSKFVLSVHDWDEPMKRVSEEAARQQLPIVTAKIGEVVFLGEERQFGAWWSSKIQ